MTNIISCLFGKHNVVTVTSECGNHYHATKLCANCAKVFDTSPPMTLAEILVVELEGAPLQ